MKTIMIGLDLAKSVFQVHGVDAEGKVDTPINRVVLGFGSDERLGRSTVPGVVGLWWG